MKFVPKPRSVAGFFIVASRHFIMGFLNGLQKHMRLRSPSALEELCGAPIQPGPQHLLRTQPAQLQAGRARSLPSRWLQQLPGLTATPCEGPSYWKAQPWFPAKTTVGHRERLWDQLCVSTVTATAAHLGLRLEGWEELLL